MDMRIIILAMLFSIPVAYSMGSLPRILAQGSAQITSPKDGALIDGEKKNMLVYDFHPGPSGNHLVIDVDKEGPAVVREWRGSYRLPLLGRGKHEICVKEANSSGISTGLQKCISVNAR